MHLAKHSLPPLEQRVFPRHIAGGVWGEAVSSLRSHTKNHFDVRFGYFC